MSCVLLKYVVLITILFRLLIEIECCSMTTNEIITLIFENPNFEQDPCYIQWNAARDAELAGIWAEGDDVQESWVEENRRRMKNEAIERENRQRSYSSSTIDRSHTIEEHPEAALKVLGAIVGVIIGICCCAACIAVSKTDDGDSTTTAIPFAHPQAQLTSVVLTLANHPTVDCSATNGNNNFSNLTEQSSFSHMPKGQDSLPSYDDAVKMASAPPIE